MKTKILLLLCLSVIFFKCTEEVDTKSPLWGVEFSADNSISFAQGVIEQKNAEIDLVYIVRLGYLRETEDGNYKLAFTFANGGSLELTMTKETADYNLNFPGNDSQNKILSATLNGMPLNLKESSISIVPQGGENKLQVISNVHTLNEGDFTGTLTRIPLVK